MNPPRGLTLAGMAQGARAFALAAVQAPSILCCLPFPLAAHAGLWPLEEWGGSGEGKVLNWSSWPLLVGPLISLAQICQPLGSTGSPRFPHCPKYLPSTVATGPGGTHFSFGTARSRGQFSWGAILSSDVYQARSPCCVALLFWAHSLPRRCLGKFAT